MLRRGAAGRKGMAKTLCPEALFRPSTAKLGQLVDHIWRRSKGVEVSNASPTAASASAPAADRL